MYFVEQNVYYNGFFGFFSLKIRFKILQVTLGYFLHI